MTHPIVILRCEPRVMSHCHNCYLEEREIVTMGIFATEAENCAAGVRGLPSAVASGSVAQVIYQSVIHKGVFFVVPYSGVW